MRNLLKRIKEDFAKELDNGAFDTWSHFRNYNDIEDKDLEEIAKRYAIEVAKEALKNASENAEVEYIMELNGDEYYQIDKQSILSETNIPELK